MSANYQGYPGWMAQAFGFENNDNTGGGYSGVTRANPQVNPQVNQPMTIPKSPVLPMGPAPGQYMIRPQWQTTVNPAPQPQQPPQIPGILRTMQNMIPGVSGGVNRPHERWSNPDIPGYRIRPRNDTANNYLNSILNYLGNNSLPQVFGDFWDKINQIRDTNIQNRENRNNVRQQAQNSDSLNSTLRYLGQ